MAWNQRKRERYEREVLADARASGRLPDDLFVRYGIDQTLRGDLRRDPAAFSTHVAEVCKYWRGLQSRRAYRKLAVDLVAAHEQLDREGALTFDGFERVSRERAQQVAREWGEIADSLTTSFLDRAELTDLACPVGVTIDVAEKELRDRGIQVVEALPQLPEKAPIGTFRTLGENLRTRGADLSAEVVFGAQRLRDGFTLLDGFQLADGTRLTSDTLADAAHGIGVEALTDSKTAAENVVSILSSAADVGQRGAIVLWEVVADMREKPPTVSESGLAQPWARRGLDSGEARLIAAAVRRADRADPVVRAEEEVRDLLAANQLRAAQAAAVALPDNHDLHAQVRRRADRVDALGDNAERLRRDREPEAAARALASALDLAADDTALAERLAGVPPLPAENPQASVDGESVVVTWNPSPSQAGVIRYRVTRKAGRAASGEVLIADTSDIEVTDTGVPAGQDVRYAVVAERSGTSRSSTVVTQAKVVTPEVSEVELSQVDGDGAVTASWSAPCGVERVMVLRGEGTPPKGVGDGVAVDANPNGFRDTGVRPGIRYHYRIQVVYLASSGRAHTSSGVVHSVTLTPRPGPVRDLSVSGEGTTGYLAAWSPPRDGELSIRRGAHPPGWPPGTLVRIEELRNYGPELLRSEEPAGPDGRARAELTLPAGRHHLLPVTLSGDLAAVGTHVTVAVTPSVRELRAERFGDVVRLSWQWPEQASGALVRWEIPDQQGAGSERRCTRIQYQADGGFEAPMGEDAVTVSVSAVTTAGSDEVRSSPVSTSVPGIVVLDYHVSPVGPLRRDRRVEVSAPRACDIPELVVVHAPGVVQPHTPDQGVELARVPAQWVEAGERVSVRVRPPKVAGPAWLMCFPARDDERGTRMRQPAVKELKL